MSDTPEGEAMSDKTLPTTDELTGSDPDFTGGLSTEEYLRSLYAEDELRLIADLRVGLARMTEERDTAERIESKAIADVARVEAELGEAYVDNRTLRSNLEMARAASSRLLDDRDQYRAALERAEAERDAAVALLRELEWSGETGISETVYTSACPVCGISSDYGHRSDCRLHTVLLATPAPTSATEGSE